VSTRPAEQKSAADAEGIAADLSTEFSSYSHPAPGNPPGRKNNTEGRSPAVSTRAPLRIVLSDLPAGARDVPTYLTANRTDPRPRLSTGVLLAASRKPLGQRYLGSEPGGARAAPGKSGKGDRGAPGYGRRARRDPLPARVVVSKRIKRVPPACHRPLIEAPLRWRNSRGGHRAADYLRTAQASRDGEHFGETTTSTARTDGLNVDPIATFAT
jgi:hypothetical protein